MTQVTNTSINNWRFFVFALLGLTAFLPGGLLAQTQVYVIEISGEVDLGLAPYVERVIEQAEESDNGVVLLHVNTFGGRVDVATRIRDAVLDASVPTIAFVDERAISAGALITLSAKHIAMSPAGSIGAATPVYGDGEKASEKVVSYMRGEMRATADRNGRNSLVAEAMVDEDIEILDGPVIVNSGKLLTLTAREASAVGFSDTVVNSVDEALEAFGYSDYEITATNTNWAEGLVRIVTSPFLSSILIMLGLGGLFYGIKTGHLGTVTIIGVSALGLFFGAQYLVELTNILEIAMFIIGVILLIVELFVIPGFGIAGVSGILLMITALFLALIGSTDLITVDSLTVPLYTLAGGFIGFGILAAVMIRFLPNSAAFRRFVLHGETVGSGGSSGNYPHYSELIGEVGEVVSTLRPAGIVEIGDQQFDVVSDGAYIPAGSSVIVVRVEGRRIVVQSFDSTSVTVVE